MALVQPNFYPIQFHIHVEKLLSDPDFRWGLPHLHACVIPTPMLTAVVIGASTDPYFEARYQRARTRFLRGDRVPPIRLAVPPTNNSVVLRDSGAALLAARELDVDAVFCSLAYDSFETALTPSWQWYRWINFYSAPPRS